MDKSEKVPPDCCGHMMKCMFIDVYGEPPKCRFWCPECKRKTEWVEGVTETAMIIPRRWMTEEQLRATKREHDGKP